jgi:hypothetical protein
MSKSINSLHASLIANLETVITSENEKATVNAERYAQTNDTDDKAAMQKAATKAKYAQLVAAMSEQAAKALLKLCDVNIDQVLSDSYSAKKFAIIGEALAKKDKSVLNRDRSLAASLAQIAVQSDTVAFNDYARAVMRELNHSSNRQASMCSTLLARLEAVTITGRAAEKTLTKNTESKLLKAIDELYA